MKILHTADWHLGKKLDSFSRIEEQIKVMYEICSIADEQQVDMVIVAGDLFDTFNPPVEAIDLFYKTLKKLSNNGKRPVIAIAGNHDSPDRIEAPNPLAKECGIIFIGNPENSLKPFKIDDSFEVLKVDGHFFEIKMEKIAFPIRIIATPYANEIRLKTYLGSENKDEMLNLLLKEKWQDYATKYCDNNGINILTSHLYMLHKGGQIYEEPEGEKPLKVGNAEIIFTDCIPPEIQYTALGHLHNYQFVKGHKNPVVYSSSPLAYSFAEVGKEKKVVIVELEPSKKAIVTPIRLKAGRELHRKRFDTIEMAVKWLLDNPNTLIELTIESDHFITNEELKKMNESHDGIIHIIPVLTNLEEITDNKFSVNLDQNLEGLFIDYFKSTKKGQLPNEEILNLFHEVLNYQSEN
ncbi:MAG: exonuclease subunit SbcD [Flavobacteriia bacterium]|nr:exonuclease subunit SbcD [Flavobacteriia bacterium]